MYKLVEHNDIMIALYRGCISIYVQVYLTGAIHALCVGDVFQRYMCAPKVEMEDYAHFLVYILLEVVSCVAAKHPCVQSVVVIAWLPWQHNYILL